LAVQLVAGLALAISASTSHADSKRLRRHVLALAISASTSRADSERLRRHVLALCKFYILIDSLDSKTLLGFGNAPVFDNPLILNNLLALA
jgi:hypothetical protein